MTVLMENAHAFEERTQLTACDESMQAVLTAIRYDLSLDPARTEKQSKKRMEGLATVVNHMAKSLGTTPEQLTVSEAVENESTFLDYVAQSSLSAASKEQLPVNRNAVLRYARKFGFSPTSFSIFEEWEPILAVVGAGNGASAIANDAIRRKRHPVDFSEADLSIWADASLDAGRSYCYVRQAQSAFLTAIRNAGSHVQSRLPQLDVAVRKLPGYRLRIKDMPESLRAEITAMVEAARAQATLSTVSMSPETKHEIIGHFEGFCGYAVRVPGMNVEDLDPLLNEPFVKQFAFWLHNDRQLKRTSVVGSLSRIFSVLKVCPEFKDRDFSWIYNIYRKLRKEPESALKERRRQHYIAYQELAAIPGRMRSERMALRNPSPISLGFRIMDELLLTFLILAQYPPRFVRGAVIGRNIFKGPIPTSGPPFKIPTWAQELLRKDPGTRFWQFCYESKEGQLVRGLVLRQVIPLLELYVNHSRPLLIGAGNDPGTVFIHRSRGPLSSFRLGQHVGNLTRRYTKMRVTPTAIRSSFAYYWREMHPDTDAALAAIQWVQYPTIKMRYDEESRQQRRARVNRRKNRYS